MKCMVIALLLVHRIESTLQDQNQQKCFMTDLYKQCSQSIYYFYGKIVNSGENKDFLIGVI